MNCIIIDDEPLAIEVLESFVHKVSFLNLCKSFTNAVEAQEYLGNNEIELIFLDIQMPDITGIEFLKTLAVKPMVILTTAYTEYAIEGYELDVLDYLVKPISFSRFLKGVNKAKEHWKSINAAEELPLQPEVSTAEEQKFIMVKSEYSIVKINLDEIDYFEGLKDYVKIYKSPKNILTLNTLKKMEMKLPSARFIRVHRSYIVPFEKIESIEKHRIIINGKRIPIGDIYKDQFYAALDKFQV